MKSKSNERSANKSGDGDLKEPLPFSRVIDIDHLPDTGREFVIEADAAERAALAAWNGLADLGKLEAVMRVTERMRGRINVRGRVTGLMTQTCVVSLEPFESAFAEEVDVDFVPAEDLAKADREAVLSYDRAIQGEDEVEPPDPIIDGKIDLGALAAEFLALALDPYPRMPGIRFEEMRTEQPEAPESPFAILRKLDKSP
jgi:uncharacterized metal-binding protein YceD (DUF177 family)